ncbi:MAG: hypothetical protein Q4G68_04565 [Planctomycetia bacterium]|nr:hypothetical protein [Planctomycetia bacterium]
MNRRKFLQGGMAAAFASMIPGSLRSETRVADAEMEELNRIAWEESLAAVRPGVPGSQPFWNGHAHGFLYTPAFDFPEVAGAISYRAEVTNEITQKKCVMTMEKPWQPITKLWEETQPGTWRLQVSGLDAAGTVCGESGSKVFVRRPAFHGPYAKSEVSFRDAAYKALENVFHLPYIKKMVETNEASPAYYNHFCYPSKMLAAFIFAMCEYSQLSEVDRSAALDYACVAADILIRTSVPNGKDLAQLPITYQGDYAVAKEHNHQIMMNYPLDVALAFLELAKAGNLPQYEERAQVILDRYCALQQEDGTWFLVYDWVQGKPVGENRLIAVDFLHLADHFIAKGDEKYRIFHTKCLQSILTGPVQTFNWSAQFEDAAPEPAYHNQAKDMAVHVARYLLKHPEYVTDAFGVAQSLVRFMEDQFVLWGPVAVPDDVRQKLRFHYIGPDQLFPLAQEQYAYMRPINASAGDAILGFLALYEKTNEPLLKAKAIALGNALVHTQYANGELPTYWDQLATKGTWLNCQVYCARVLAEMDRVLS